LDVKQLREILIEIISWDATGKDIFDTDYLFQDPIKGIPDLTVREYDGDAFLEWVEPNPILQPNISITARVAKILLASKKQPDLYQVALQFIYAQKCFKDDSTNLKITLSLSLLFVHAKKHNQTQRFQSFLEDFSKFRPIIAKEVRNFSKRYNTHLSAHLQVYKNFIDIEVIYLDILYNIFECLRDKVTDEIVTNENIKISNHTLDQLLYRFSAHHSNLTHNIQQIKMKIFATSVVREKSKAEMKWHESYLESIGEIGKIFFLGLHNLEENSATLPRLVIPPDILRNQFNDKENDFSRFWTNSDRETLFDPDYSEEDSY